MNIEQLINESTLSESEKNLFNYIINNVDLCIESGIRTVAKENYVSTSSIIRLAKKLNYSGYTDMLYDIKYNHSRQKKNIPFSFTNLIYHNETICEKNIIDFVELLKRQNIFIFGTGYSEIVCQYFYKKLLINDFRTYKADGLEFHSFLHHRNIDIGSVIFVSKSGTTSYIVQIAQQAKKQGVPIISFTGNMSNPLKELSDIAFVIEDGIKYDYDNSEYTPFFGQTILLFEKLMNEFTSEVSTAPKHSGL